MMYNNVEQNKPVVQTYDSLHKHVREAKILQNYRQLTQLTKPCTNFPILIFKMPTMAFVESIGEQYFVN